MKKQVLGYVIATATLGVAMGVLMSMGVHVYHSILASTGFWACMLAPMLIKN
jgi:hypothetical protein